MKLSKVIKFIEKIFVAVAFAEANCHDMIEYNAEDAEYKDTIDTFLKNVGLQNAKVAYGLVEA